MLHILISENEDRMREAFQLRHCERMTEDARQLILLIYRAIDEIADGGQEALSEIAELLYYAGEPDALQFLRRFVFMPEAEKQAVLAAMPP